MTGSRRERRMLAAAAVATTRAVGPDAQMPRKDRAAAVSIASNALLIVLKLAAAAITGSIAILTEAVHSSIDLIASMVAFYSVRKADEPADEDHPYGHQKVENLAAAIEGMLILLGAGIIIFESVRRLSQGTEIESIGVGIAVIAFSAVANLVVSGYLYRRARATDSPALEGDAAHLRADAFTSMGVLVGLGLVEITGVEAFDADHGAPGGRRDRVRGTEDPQPLVTGAGGRDASRPRARRGAPGDLRSRRAPRWWASTSSARAGRGAAAISTCTCSSGRARAFSGAHQISHELQNAIKARLRGADVLIHLEPEAPSREVHRGGGADGG